MTMPGFDSFELYLVNRLLHTLLFGLSIAVYRYYRFDGDDNNIVLYDSLEYGKYYHVGFALNMAVVIYTVYRYRRTTRPRFPFLYYKIVKRMGIDMSILELAAFGDVIYQNIDIEYQITDDETMKMFSLLLLFGVLRIVCSIFLIQSIQDLAENQCYDSYESKTRISLPLFTNKKIGWLSKNICDSALILYIYHVMKHQINWNLNTGSRVQDLGVNALNVCSIYLSIFMYCRFARPEITFANFIL